MKNKTTKCRGSVLVFTIIITGIMMATAMSLISVSSIERKTSSATGKSTASFQAADTGIEIVLAEMNDPTKTLVSHLNDCVNTPGPTYGKIVSDAAGYTVTLYDRSDPIEEILCNNSTARIGEIGRLKSVGSKSQTVRAVQVDIPGDVLDESLVSYWEFDTINSCGLCAGNTTPDSRGGNIGTVVGGVTEELGQVGDALKFGGSGYVSVVDSDSLREFPNGLSIGLWIKSSETNNVPISRWGANNGYGLYIDDGATNDGDWYMGYDADWVHISADRQTDNQWHHYVLTYDKDKMRSYRDGSFISSDDLTGATYDNPANNMLTIGADNRGPGLYFTGQIDDVRIYDRALTSNEVKRIFNATK